MLAVTACSSGDGTRQADPSVDPSVQEASWTLANPKGGPSNLLVDIEAFSNWEDKIDLDGTSSSYREENSKAYACDQFFMANGLPGQEDFDPSQIDGSYLLEWMKPRVQMAWSLNLDTASARHYDIADYLVECLTWPTDEVESGARERLVSEFGYYRGTLPMPGMPPLEYERVTRQSETVDFNSTFGLDVYVVEVLSAINPGPVYDQNVFVFPRADDVRLAAIYDGDEPIDWGGNPLEILDAER